MSIWREMDRMQRQAFGLGLKGSFVVAAILFGFFALLRWA